MVSHKMMAAVALALFSSANAHLYMRTPTPIQGNAIKDPLDGSGSNFPCHGATIPTSGGQPMAVGSSQILQFELGNGANTAVHGGGSCQLSVTYETDPTKLKDPSSWKVIHSIIGGCPSNTHQNLDGPGMSAIACSDPSSNGVDCINSFNYTIPRSLKSGQATLAWTWFNSVGNREMYMNCAAVSITGGTADSTAFNSLPNMFVANLASVNKCPTTASVDLQFPNPGTSVQTKLPEGKAAATAIVFPKALPTGAGCDAAAGGSPAASSSAAPGAYSGGAQATSITAPSVAASSVATSSAAAISAATSSQTANNGGVYVPGAVSSTAASSSAFSSSAAPPAAASSSAISSSATLSSAASSGAAPSSAPSSSASPSTAASSNAASPNVAVPSVSASSAASSAPSSYPATATSMITVTQTTTASAGSTTGAPAAGSASGGSRGALPLLSSKRPSSAAGPSVPAYSAPASSAAPAAPASSSAAASPNTCTNGAAPCSTDGEFICLPNNKWGICNWGCAYPMPVAPGMQCLNGAYVAAKQKRHPHGFVHRRSLLRSGLRF